MNHVVISIRPLHALRLHALLQHGEKALPSSVDIVATLRADCDSRAVSEAVGRKHLRSTRRRVERYGGKCA